MKRDWRKAGIEPSLGEMTADPIIRLVAHGHGQSADDLRRALELAQRAVRRKSRARARPGSLWRPHAAPARRNPWCRLSRLCEGIVPLAGTTVAVAALVMLARLQGW